MPVTNPFGPLTSANGYLDPLSPDSDLRTSCVLFGIFIGLAASILVSVVRASGFEKRPFRFTWFKFLIWAQWSVCTTFGTIEWARYQHYFPPSFAYFFCDVFLWCLQTHFLAQIVCNRVGILVNNKRTQLLVKLSVFAWILILNVFVWVGWMPVALQVPTLIYYKMLIPLNCIVTGGIMLTDIVLNTWFVFTVRQRLVSLGLKKYDALVYMNLLFLCGSVALDALTLGLMFMSNKGIYLHIYPIAYIIKLAIELSLSSLIVRIAAEKPSSRVPAQTVSQMSNYDRGITSHIRIDVDQDVKSIKDDSVEIIPSFGQYIRRPAYGQTDSDSLAYGGQSSSIDEKDDQSISSRPYAYV